MYIYNGWTTTRLVPVPYRQEERSSLRSKTPASFDIEYWITAATLVPNKRWVRVSKESSTYAVFFFTTRNGSTDEFGQRSDELYAGDVLFLKLRNGTVVDADEGDVILLRHDIAHYVV